MGWSVITRTPADRQISDKEFILTHELYSLADDLIDHAQAGSTHFFVWRNPATGERSAVVVLTSKSRNDFGIKVLDESCGPADDRCPKRILDQLDPPPNQYAAAWRAKCDQRRARSRTAARLKPGDVIRFRQPLAFTGGHQFQTFEYVKGSTFRADGYGGNVRVTGWRARTDWEPVAASDAPEGR